jgi:hypothetical protein
MDLICHFCNREFESDPILIPCGWTICKHHTDENEINECKYCTKPHKNDQNYPIIKPIQVILEQKRQIEKIPKLIERVECMKSIQQDPYGFVNGLFDNLIGQANQTREIAVQSIESHFIKEIEKINNFKESYSKMNFDSFKAVDFSSVLQDLNELLEKKNENKLGN